MKRLIYTCVFGDYDIVSPPLIRVAGTDYYVITEDENLKVQGWTTLVVDISGFETPKSANLYYRALIHRVLPGYDTSIYTDGNIKIVDKIDMFLHPFEASGCSLGLFPHEFRTTVGDEVDACVQRAKVKDEQSIREEYASYLDRGFADESGLIETGVILKNHNNKDLEVSMSQWWECFRQRNTRDQISLPYVLWLTQPSVYLYDFSYRKYKSVFLIYPHKNDVRYSMIYKLLWTRSRNSVFWFYSFVVIAKARASLTHIRMKVLKFLRWLKLCIKHDS